MDVFHASIALGVLIVKIRDAFIRLSNQNSSIKALHQIISRDILVIAFLYSAFFRINKM